MQLFFNSALTCRADCCALNVSEQASGGQINNLLFNFVHGVVEECGCSGAEDAEGLSGTIFLVVE